MFFTVRGFAMSVSCLRVSESEEKGCIWSKKCDFELLKCENITRVSTKFKHIFSLNVLEFQLLASLTLKHAHSEAKNMSLKWRKEARKEKKENFHLFYS
jgi:hypothetical protein